MAKDLIPEETAKAIQEAAKLLSKVIDAGAGIGRYLDTVFDRVPHNLVGYFGGDWLAEQRMRNAERLRADTEEIRRSRGTQERVEISPSVAIPLIQAAIDEDRDGLKEMWARLLAAAMDPARTHLVRPSLIELLKQFDPLDAFVLREMTGPNFQNIIVPGSDLAQSLGGVAGVPRDETHLSLEHLYELGCLRQSPDEVPRPPVTAKGRALIRAVSD
jgi:hypothetical protein